MVPPLRGSPAVTTFRSQGRVLGRVHSGDIGRQGDSPAPGALLPVTLPRTVSGEAIRLRATVSSRLTPARLDAVMLEPLVSRLVLRGNGHGTALLSSASERKEVVRVEVHGNGNPRIHSYDGQGRLVKARSGRGRVVFVGVPAGGFAFVRR
ncbi:hypothetical protein BH18ACT9_BH18ACT9_19210 [soil metagenome]